MIRANCIAVWRQVATDIIELGLCGILLSNELTEFHTIAAAIISAAFSPIMIDAALVLPLTMLGMTLASATRSLPDARDAQVRIDDTRRSGRCEVEVIHG